MISHSIKGVITVICTVMTFFSFSQTNYFNKAIDFNNQVDLFYNVLNATDSNYVCIGKSTNPQNTNEGNYLVYVNDYKNVFDTIKSYYFPNTKYWSGKGELTYDNNYIHLSTKIHSSIGGDEDLFLVKLNLLGDTIWTKTFYDTSYFSNGIDVVEADDNGLVLVGWEYAKNDWDSRLFLIKTDSIGNEIWRKNYQKDNYIESVFSLIKNDDGGFVFTGKEAITGGDFVGTVYKVDSAGNQIWKNVISSSSGSVAASDIIQSKEGGYLVVGGTTISNIGRGFAEKITENGFTQWDSIYGVPNTFNMDLSEELMSIIQLEDSSYVMAGITRNVDLIADGFLGEDDGWIIKTDMNGIELWSRVYTNSYSAQFSKPDYFYDFSETNDKGFIAIGSCMNANQDGWIIKLDSCGCDSISCWYDSTQNCGIQVIDTNDSTGIFKRYNEVYTLKLFPNPTSSFINIRFPYIENANIKIVDAKGQIVDSYSIWSQKFNKTLDVSAYDKGIYYIYLFSNKFQLTNKFVVE